MLLDIKIVEVKLYSNDLQHTFKLQYKKKYNKVLYKNTVTKSDPY